MSGPAHHLDTRAAVEVGESTDRQLVDLVDEDAADRGYRVANAVSYTLNPLVLPPVAFALLDAHFGARGLDVLWTFIISGAFFGVVPLVYILRLVRRGRAESLEVRDRATRLGPFLMALVSYAIGALLLALTVDGPARPVILAFASIYPINTVLLLLINTRWKISLHMSGLAAFVTVLLFAALTTWRDLPAGIEGALSVAFVAPMVVMLPLLMWARVRVGAHTWGQVAAGTAFGLVVPLVELIAVVHVWLDVVG